MRGSVRGRGVYGLQRRLGVTGGPLEGVVARLAALVEEGPVAGLDGEQLARGAQGGGAAQAGGERPQQAQLQPPRPPGEVGDGRRVPGAQVLALAPGRGGERARDGLVLGERLRDREQAHPRPLRAGQHLAQPDRPLRPPVAEQLGVDREDEQAAAAVGPARTRAGAPPPPRGTPPPGGAPRPPPPPGRRHRRRSSRSAPRAATCRRTGRGRGRTDSRRATRATGSPPSRSAAPPGPPRSRPAPAPPAAPPGRSGRRRTSAPPAPPAATPARGHRRTRAARSRRPSRTAAGASGSRRRAAAAAPPGWPAAAAPRGSRPRPPAPPSPPRPPPETPAADRRRPVQQLQRPPVARQLRLAGIPALGRHLERVGLRRTDPPLDQELAATAPAPRRPPAGRPAPA